jgi:methylated-DNA-protein-cysteine methyltransferase related protein
LFDPSCREAVAFARLLPYVLIVSSGEVFLMSSWDAVYRIVKQIPRGRVLTYGALAKLAHLPGGGRTAGRAMAATPRGKGIPWHRVLGAGGKLLIREPFSSLQRKLLESEGVPLRERRVDLKGCLWTPSRSKKPKAKPKAPANRLLSSHASKP